MQHHHNCPGCCSGPGHDVRGKFISGHPNVFCNGKPAVRMSDPGVQTIPCCGTNVFEAKQGCQTVYIGGLPAHGGGMVTVHCKEVMPMPGITDDSTCSKNVQIPSV
jgi:uncharacterized Zn-binding protein involved in type VI secretion